ncbi:uncharacterized protein A4U43_C01F4150 [Asparagus officinalis]|uniref:Cyclin N-terminal domain-containing protein n=1 Tax=Asparagus officinalis TaxID=4686 RepID=A0A5P1FRB9_ASPOF|nr:uncharacterized protein A4U43_C01F4150 [Asparagus officinalis]
MAFRLEVPRPGIQTEDLFAIEFNHRTSISFPIDLNQRQWVVFYIRMAERSCNLHPRVVYLAINYGDRLIHNNQVQEPHYTSVIAAVCLFLASRHSDSGRPLSIFDLREDDGFEYFSYDEGHRAEVQVMNSLNGDLNSVTPFAFLHFYLSRFYPKPISQHWNVLTDRASEMLFDIQTASEGILKYRPSVIAAAVLLCSVKEQFPRQFAEFLRNVSTFELIEEV